MHSGERKDFTLAAITPHMIHGMHLNIVVGELKGLSSLHRTDNIYHQFV